MISDADDPQFEAFPRPAIKVEGGVLTPDAFFDVVLPNEKLAVIKVVALVLRRSGWPRESPDGAPISYSDFERTMGMSRQSVVEGVNGALSRGYIRIVKGGVHRGPNSEAEAARYAIRWR